MDIREWADLHGEIRMTMRQFWIEERRAEEARWMEQAEESRDDIPEEYWAYRDDFCCVMAAMHMGHDEDCGGRDA